jgi:hypothetical protein
MEDEGITTGEFAAFVEEETNRPSSSSPPPQSDFMHSPEVKNLGASQRKARSMVSGLLMMLQPKK